MGKTALQMALDKVNTLITDAENKTVKTEDIKESLAYLTALDLVVIDLQSLLPKEREIIEEAVNAGVNLIDTPKCGYTSGSDYYDTNYSQTENKEG